MLRLIKVTEYLRGYTLRSLFVADDEDMAHIKEWCQAGREVYFGEIAGKHSDLTLTFTLDEFKVVSEDQEFIEKFQLSVGNCFGVNILARMCEKCESCGEYCDDLVDDKCSDCLEEQDGD